ncbi:hypothetical protein HPHPA17_0113 [Helicobacter pylori Hp A-17]|nr:hypothetical protein HPHPA17_0113 [Helicobacter pylori Hp A-17]
MMITEYFSILLRKSFLQQISSNQISFFRKNHYYNKSQAIKVKNPFFIATPIQTTPFLLKSFSLV